MLRPLRDRIVVKPLERKRSDELLVVDSENEQFGQVVAIGPGKRTKKGVIQSLDVKPGDLIRFGADYLNFPSYTENGQKYLVLQEADVAGIVDAA